MAKDSGCSQAALDNYSNQLNPEHDAYWQSRGYSGCPNDDDYEDGYIGDDD